ncbi:MAG TPA: hypothetical protein ENN98_05285 [Desulfurivibrio alkaliphilus]|uniref:Uncharacterized protein n=1 Tax=Desulfurivibrio alkaliphilus TaxID=427923 RepID=A0A7C2XMS3_9BACT|nr:hypothetical protein [Desulfurivibrio alkaliphilus]
MAILSYLALPVAGKKEQLCAELAAMECCEVVSSDNRGVVLLVTDTPDSETEKWLQRELRKQLIEYCHQDTIALVRLVHFLMGGGSQAQTKGVA